MTFYDDKRKAMGLIEALIKENKNTIKDISLEVMRETGFGKRFITNYINDLKDSFVIKENEAGVLVWIKENIDKIAKVEVEKPIEEPIEKSEEKQNGVSEQQENSKIFR